MLKITLYFLFLLVFIRQEVISISGCGGDIERPHLFEIYRAFGIQRATQELKNNSILSLSISRYDKTPVMAAAKHGCLDLLQALLRHGINQNYINLTDSDNRTALHYVCHSFDEYEFTDQKKYQNKIEIIKLLVEHGAYVNAQTKNKKMTPLHFLFLSYKRYESPLLYKPEKFCIDIQPLIEIFSFLISHGANPDIENIQGNKPLIPGIDFKPINHTYPENNTVSCIIS